MLFMKIIIALSTLIVVSLPACTRKVDLSKVPATVKESFSRQFPGAVPVWEKEDGKYEAGFKQSGHEMSALFEANGMMTESEIEIPVAELSESIKTYMQAHYKGATIKGAAKITSVKGKIEYEAAIKGKDILFDTNGIFIKEVSN